MNVLGGLRIAWRLSVRDARLTKRRTILVLLLVALPTGLMTLAISTVVSSRGESATQPKVYGSAAATFSTSRIEPLPSTAELRSVLELAGPNEVLVEQQLDDTLTINGEARYVHVTDVDVRHPLTHGLFTLVSGRWPRNGSEVALGDAKGIQIGEVARLDRLERPVRVVGSFRSTRNLFFQKDMLFGLSLESMLVGFPGSVEVASLPFRGGNDSVAVFGSQKFASAPPQLTAQLRTLHLQPVLLSPGERQRIDSARYLSVTLVGLVGIIIAMSVVAAILAVEGRRRLKAAGILSIAGCSRAVIVGTQVIYGGLCGLLGSLLGVVGGLGILAVMHHPHWLTPTDVAIPILGSTIVGLAAGFVPGLQLARISPMQALSARMSANQTGRAAGILGWTAIIFGMIFLTGMRLGGIGYHMGLNRSFAAGSLSPLRTATGLFSVVIGMWILIPWFGIAPAKLIRTRTVESRLASQSLVRNNRRNGALIVAMSSVLGLAVFVSWASDIRPVPTLSGDEIEVSAFRHGPSGHTVSVDVTQSNIEDVLDIAGPSKVIELRTGWGAEAAGYGLGNLFATDSLVAHLRLPAAAKAALDAGTPIVLARESSKCPRSIGLPSHNIANPICVIHRFDSAAVVNYPVNRTFTTIVPKGLQERFDSVWIRTAIQPIQPIDSSKSNRLRVMMNRIEGDVTITATTTQASGDSIKKQNRERVQFSAFFGFASVAVSLLLVWLGIALGERDAAEDDQVLLTVGADTSVLARISRYRALALSTTSLILAIMLGGAVGLAQSQITPHSYPDPFLFGILLSTPLLSVLFSRVRSWFVFRRLA
jgi:hypothetical protein